MNEEWVDLSQPFYQGMPAPSKEMEASIDYLRVVGKTGHSTVTKYTFVTHIGTHVDAPCHFIPNGKTIDSFPVGHFIGPGVVINLLKEPFEPITKKDLSLYSDLIRPKDIVLIGTKWDKRAESDSYFDHPYLEEELAIWLIEKEIKMVGVDFITVDVPRKKRTVDLMSYPFPIHKSLLGNDVLIIENLANLDKLDKRVIVSAIPIFMKGRDGAPARVVAKKLSE